jgi:hypothetical protein
VEQHRDPRAGPQALQARGARVQEGDRSEARPRDLLEEPRQHLPRPRAGAGSRLDPTILESQGPAIPAAGIDAATQSYYLAKLLAANGQVDAAIEFLRRAKEAGFRDFARVASDPDFRAVVADPRYKELAP